MRELTPEILIELGYKRWNNGSPYNVGTRENKKENRQIKNQYNGTE